MVLDEYMGDEDITPIWEDIRNVYMNELYETARTPIHLKPIEKQMEFGDLKRYMIICDIVSMLTRGRKWLMEA